MSLTSDVNKYAIININLKLRRKNNCGNTKGVSALAFFY
jgi:hypothetical protein